MLCQSLRTSPYKYKRQSTNAKKKKNNYQIKNEMKSNVTSEISQTEKDYTKVAFVYNTNSTFHRNNKNLS